MAAWERINGVVYGVIGLHLFIYFATVSCVIIPWLSYSVPGLGHLLALSGTVAASLACLITAVVSDPGSVPEDYAPELEAQHSVVEVKKKSGGTRVCQKCGHGKPPRAHHCRVCRRCILRMDHHCPWLNNCVGHGNYRAFLQFLAYATAATCHALGLLAAHAVYALSAATASRIVRTGIQSRAVGLAAGAPGLAPASYSISWAALQICATAAALPLAVALCGLCVWNAWLVSQNKTTIEYHEGITAQVRAARGGAAAGRHPYHLGPLSNAAAVMGPVGPAWCLPLTAAADGTGTAFPTIWDSERLAPG